MVVSPASALTGRGAEQHQGQDAGDGRADRRPREDGVQLREQGPGGGLVVGRAGRRGESGHSVNGDPIRAWAA